MKKLFIGTIDCYKSFTDNIFCTYRCKIPTTFIVLYGFLAVLINKWTYKYLLLSECLTVIIINVHINIPYSRISVGICWCFYRIIVNRNGCKCIIVLYGMKFRSTLFERRRGARVLFSTITCNAYYNIITHA